ncbi:MAG: thiamine ABC transporter substrate-binding protein [Paracoccaceae bacterium]|jgi:thiamine transport system substrate-binding protein|nr:thiamine ABC transporter substrate binding subunit [Paracoccaceae bacterium]MDA0850523.1 thiamine ABC transporter substrate binding subunit [Pseudomonadota bacterium]
MKHFTFAAGLLSASMALADAPVLTVYAPDYFASEWGPGPSIEAAFEKECNCDLQFKTGDVLSRIILEGARSEADVVIGLNTDVTKKARETGLFAAHGQDNSQLTLPLTWTDQVFLPFNYGHTAFVYNAEKLREAPQSFDALIHSNDELKVIIQDPRSSISGLALVLWVKAVFGEEAENVWEKLAPKILTVTKGWSEAYGLFTEGEADMVLSYTTSPAYHIVAEGDLTKKAAIFPEGHYLMVELAAKLKGTDNPELADAFLAFIMTDTFQNLIPEGNWSLPAALEVSEWPQAFQELPLPEKVLFYSEEEAATLRGVAIEEWRRALSK